MTKEAIQQLALAKVTTPKIANNQRIHQHKSYTAKSDCRLGITSISGSLLPNIAKRWALSRLPKPKSGKISLKGCSLGKLSIV